MVRENTWWQKRGLDKNPFDIWDRSNPVIQKEPGKSRNYIEKYMDILTTENKNMMLFGPPGNGKTLYLNETYNRLLEYKDVIPVLITESEKYTSEDKSVTFEKFYKEVMYPKLLEHYAPDHDQKITYGKKLSMAFYVLRKGKLPEEKTHSIEKLHEKNGKKLVLLIDEFQKMNVNIINGIKSLNDQENKFVNSIMISQVDHTFRPEIPQPLYRRFHYKLEVPKLDKKGRVIMLTKRDENSKVFNEKAIKFLCEKYTIPSELLKACDNIAEYFADHSERLTEDDIFQAISGGAAKDIIETRKEEAETHDIEDLTRRINWNEYPSNISPLQKKIITYLTGFGPRTAKEVADAIGSKSQNTINVQLSKLIKIHGKSKGGFPIINKNGESKPIKYNVTNEFRVKTMKD